MAAAVGVDTPPLIHLWGVPCVISRKADAGREQGGPGIKRLYGDYVKSLEKNDMGR